MSSKTKNPSLSKSSSAENNDWKKKFIIEDVITKNVDMAEPCLVQFSNGVLKNNNGISGKLLRYSSTKYLRKNKERMLKVSTPQLSYIGKNFGEEVASDSSERMFLGILDENTKKMRLVEMSTFLLQPDLTPHTSSESQLSGDSVLLKSRNRALMEAFGGRRGRIFSKRGAEKEYNINDMSVALHDALDNVEPGEATVEDGTDEYKAILPHCNEQTTLPWEVYPLASIVSDDVLLPFNSDALEYLYKDKDPSGCSTLFSHTLAYQKTSSEEDEVKSRLMCVALFTEVLIKLLKTDIRKRPSLDPCPKIVQTKVFSMFTEGKDKKRTNTLLDKLIVHIVILALTTNQFEVPIVTLVKSLGIMKQRLEMIVRVVGATWVHKGGYVALKLPLVKMFKGIPKKKQKYK